MARDGNAELHPSVRIVGCVLDQSVGQSDAARGDEKPAPIKSLHRGIQSDTQLSAEQGIISNITVLEDDVADGSTVLTHLAFGAPERHAVGSRFDEESTDRRPLVCFTGLRKYCEKTSKRCVGNKTFLSVQDPSLPFSFSPGLDRSRIRSGVGFRQREGSDDLAACQPRHETVLLRRRPVARQGKGFCVDCHQFTLAVIVWSEVCSKSTSLYSVARSCETQVSQGINFVRIEVGSLKNCTYVRLW